ncbi:MAG: DUF1320 family protein [Prevotellaceae bacterium]|jgi:phage gp36-like protein|nr:DUF1320 family protein [Prevotellaceae bacterium]
MLVTIEELGKTSLYPEIIQKITRGSNDAAELCILEAESLARSYMSKYNLDAIFGNAESEPTFTGQDINLVKKIIKIIASYYLVRKANPNVNVELFRADYEDALTWLESLQAGNVNPDLPYKPDSSETGGDNSDVYFNSLPKQNNFF